MLPGALQICIACAENVNEKSERAGCSGRSHTRRSLFVRRSCPCRASCAGPSWRVAGGASDSSRQRVPESRRRSSSCAAPARGVGGRTGSPRTPLAAAEEAAEGRRFPGALGTVPCGHAGAPAHARLAGPLEFRGYRANGRQSDAGPAGVPDEAGTRGRGWRRGSQDAGPTATCGAQSTP